jgi:hypothetical protein
MTKTAKPSKIELTSAEEDLISQINFDPRHENAEYEEILRTSRQNAAVLMQSIIDRGAIPDIRLQYFTDPELNIGTKMSRKEVFEHNGTRGSAIFEHSHFLKYLRYFIFGPQLPDPVIDGFVKQVNDWYMELDSLCKSSRQAVRQYGMDPHTACEEFHKLALECGLEHYEARMIRDAVRTVR